MKPDLDYLEINRASWNKRTDAHIDSEFYDNPSFIKGRNSLNSIELGLLGDVKGLKILHLQCHFGQDSISLSRMGAEVTGIDFSENAISQAKALANTCRTNTRFIQADLYEAPNLLKEQFDAVFTSYGTIGWLPDIDQWAQVVGHFLKPGGRFVYAEFHPVVWMFDDDFSFVKYNYFKAEPIIESEEGTYADKEAEIQTKCITWNHSLSAVYAALTQAGIHLNVLQEFNYSPYNCFSGTKEIEPGKFIIEKLGDKIPMVYALHGIKS
jgi:ubiquinone/menaquinone biosynthesis C-methylase UbiE